MVNQYTILSLTEHVHRVGLNCSASWRTDFSNFRFAVTATFFFYEYTNFNHVIEILKAVVQLNTGKYALQANYSQLLLQLLCD